MRFASKSWCGDSWPRSGDSLLRMELVEHLAKPAGGPTARWCQLYPVWGYRAFDGARAKAGLGLQDENKSIEVQGEILHEDVEREKMVSDQQIDTLVDEITRRVTARLATEGAPESTQGTGYRGPRTGSSSNMGKAVAESVASVVGEELQNADLASLIDHPLLKPDASREELEKLCSEARKYGFATVCVNATNVRLASSLLDGCSTKAIAVVGFPLGAMTPGAKAYETREAVRNGGAEIDMVINIGAMKSKDYALVLEDIASVVSAASTKPVKVILETASLT